MTLKRTLKLPALVVWHALFWTYERATWQYDLMVIAILLFVWGTPPDLGNFRRKVLGTEGFVVPTDTHGSPSEAGGRKALLYRRGPATLIQPPMLRRS